jgi:hypothetical protein
VSDAVVAGLAGVAVGALLNFALTQLLERQRARRGVRGVARILKRDLLGAFMALQAGLAHHSWPHEPNHQFRLDHWQELRVQLAGAMGDRHDFESVYIAFEWMEAENQRFQEVAELTFDEAHLRKVQTHVVGQAMFLLRLGAQGTRLKRATAAGLAA